MFINLIRGLCLTVAVLATVVHAEEFVETDNIYQTETDVADAFKPEAAPTTVDRRQLKCLADNIYHESRGEPLQGQIAVARVVMNRVLSGFAPNPCGVVYQTLETINRGIMLRICQFSWFCQNMAPPKTDSPQYQLALMIAYDVLAYNAYADVIPRSVLFFHTTGVRPGWKLRSYERIGNHIFYHGKII